MLRFRTAQLIQIAGSGTAGNNTTWIVDTGTAVTYGTITLTAAPTDQAVGTSITLTDVTDPVDDTRAEGVISAASRMIDTYCGRQFYSSASDTREFTPTSECRCFVDDLQSITTLKTDENVDGTYEITWATSDYWLMPNNPVNGEPYTWIEAKPWGNYSFYPGEKLSVQIAGTFGWAAVPDPIREACLLQALRLYKRSAAPFGVVESISGEQRILQAIDPDVETMILPYKRTF